MYMVPRCSVSMEVHVALKNVRLISDLLSRCHQDLPSGRVRMEYPVIRGLKFDENFILRSIRISLVEEAGKIKRRESVSSPNQIANRLVIGYC